VSYAAGLWLQGHEQQQTRAVLADGRAPAELASGSEPASRGGAPQKAVQHAGPAALPPWVQAARGTKLWSAPTGDSALATLTQWQFLKVVGADRRRMQV